MQSELHGLRERLENIASELTTAQTESSQLRQQLDAQRSEFAQEKKSLEDAIADMNTVEERAKADQEDVRADVRKQAQLAREAHAKYEQELVAHAEDVKALSSIKEQLAQAQNAVREAQTAAETAQANLTGSQASWESQKASIEKEVGDLRKRYVRVTAKRSSFDIPLI